MTKHHFLDVYGFYLHLVTSSQEWSALRRKIPALSKATELGGYGTVELVLKPRRDLLPEAHLVIHINTKGHLLDKSALLDTVTHEAFHAGAKIFEHLGISYNGESEPLAYLIAWITCWVWESLC